MSCFYQHASLPFTVPYQKTPLRGSIFHSRGPSNPPLTLTFVHLPALFSPFLVSMLAFFPSPSMSVKIDQFTGGTGRQNPASPPPAPQKHTNSHTGPTARDPALLTEVEGRGGMTKTTACVEEHCLRLRPEIFSGKTGFYTQWSWVWRKGAHIKRSAFMCAELLVFKLHLNGEGPICSFFHTTRL